MKFLIPRGKPLAEGEGFEPTVSYPTPVFKTGALSHSAIPPDLANFASVIVSYIHPPDKLFLTGRHAFLKVGKGLKKATFTGKL